MKSIRVGRGLNLKMKGRPQERFGELDLPDYVAVRASDFRFLKPKLTVRLDEKVKAGQVLFEDKLDPSVVFVAPASGQIVDIKRGARRTLLEVVIACASEQQYESFEVFKEEDLNAENREKLVLALKRAGLWPFIRQFPFETIANSDAVPRELVVTCFGSEPGMPDFNFILKDAVRYRQFLYGLRALKAIHPQLTLAFSDDISTHHDAVKKGDLEGFGDVLDVSGNFPACHAGAQAYRHRPLKRGETLWFCSMLSVLQIAESLQEGRVPTKKVVALSGANVLQPQYFTVHPGASIKSICAGRVANCENRYISGSVFTGSDVNQDKHAVESTQVGEQSGLNGYVGCYDHTVYVLPERRQYSFMGFVLPSFKKHSTSRVHPTALLPWWKFDMDTAMNGEVRACVQCNMCTQVCPVDILPDRLFKSIKADDFDEAEQLGLHDCVDCGLCTYACPSKIEIGSYIESMKRTILKESMQ